MLFSISCSLFQDHRHKWGRKVSDADLVHFKIKRQDYSQPEAVSENLRNEWNYIEHYPQNMYTTWHEMQLMQQKIVKNAEKTTTSFH